MMSEALAGPMLAAAALLCLSGAAKLRAPATAATAVGMLGLRVGPSTVRGLAAGECAAGLGALLTPSRPLAVVVAAAYAAFVAVTLALRRARASCGCFGDSGAPASGSGAALSAALAAVCALAAVGGPHGLGWVLGLPAATAATLSVGVAGCVAALVLVYTELPAAWAAWSGR